MSPQRSISTSAPIQKFDGTRRHRSAPAGTRCPPPDHQYEGGHCAPAATLRHSPALPPDFRIATLVRPIHTASLDKSRPVLVLTRDLVRPHLNRVTVAPITTSVRGLSTEVPVGRANGLDADGVVSCDNIVTVPTGALGPRIGMLLPTQEDGLTAAIHAAFDLE